MIAAMNAGNPAGIVRVSEYFVRRDPENAQNRILSWTPERSTGVVYHILFDGLQYSVSETVEAIVKTGHLFPRSVIEVIETSPQNATESTVNVSTLPGDRVRIAWDAVAGATRYELFRRPSVKLSVNFDFVGRCS